MSDWFDVFVFFFKNYILQSVVYIRVTLSQSRALSVFPSPFFLFFLLLLITTTDFVNQTEHSCIQESDRTRPDNDHYKTFKHAN